MTKKWKKDGLKSELLRRVRRDVYISKDYYYGRLFFILMGTSQTVMSTDRALIEQICREQRLKAAKERYSMKMGKRRLKF